VKADVERILDLFSGRVAHHRAKAIRDVLAVATGEVGLHRSAPQSL
jgi:ClpP class serine protease